MKTTTITLPNGSTAIDFTPQDSKEKAIVHLSVIQELARLLPKAHPQEIQEHLLDRLSSNSKLEHLVEVCKDFVAFHETVNLITSYVPESNGMPKVLGKINLHPDNA